MAYTYDPIFAQDPNNPNVVASNATITIYNPADATKAPIAITDSSGSPLPNPIKVDGRGMGPAFQHPTLDRVAWIGGGFQNFFTSYEGMKNEAVAAKEAAQDAANTATTAAAEVVTTAAVNGAGELVLQKASGGTLNAGSVKGPKGDKGDPGQNGSNVLPTDDAIEQAIKAPASKTAAALSATYATKGELAAAGAPTAGTLSAVERVWLEDYNISRRDSTLFAPPFTPLATRPVLATVTHGTSTDVAGKKRVSYFRAVDVTLVGGNTTITATGTSTFDAADVGKQLAGTSGAFAAASTIVSITDATHAVVSTAPTGNTSTTLWIGRADNNFTLIGSEALVPAATTGLTGTGAVRPGSTANGVNFLTQAFTLQGVFTGQKFATHGQGQSSGNARIQVYVDEGFGWEAITASETQPTTSAGTVATMFDFGSSATRKIRLELSNYFSFQGVYLWDPANTWTADPVTSIAAAYIGDSYVEQGLGGATATQDKMRSFAGISAKLLGYRSFFNLGQSGTGWLNPGTGVRANNAKLRDRITDVVARNLDVLHIAMGTNDASYTSTQIQDEVSFVLNRLKTESPRTRVYVTGPWSVANSATMASLVNVAAGVEAACIAAGVPSINPAAGRIVTGAGKVLVDGDPWIPAASPYLTADGTHVTTAGSIFLGYKHAAAVARIEQERRYPPAA